MVRFVGTADKWKCEACQVEYDSREEAEYCEAFHSAQAELFDTSYTTGSVWPRTVTFRVWKGGRWHYQTWVLERRPNP